MVAAIERRDAVEGCGCVRCRDVDPTLLRRSTAGDLLWSLRLFRRRPRLLAVVAGLALLHLGLPSLIAPVTPATWLGVRTTAVVRYAASVLLLVVVLRGFFGAIVATELTDENPDVRRILAYTTRRLVPLALTVGGLFSILGVTLGVSIAVVSVLVFDVGLFRPAIFDGITPTLLFGSILAPVFYKFWIAPEVCVVGKEGPLTALKASWRITTTRWRRVCLLIVSFTATISTPYVAAELLALVGRGGISSVPAFSVLRVQFQWITAVVWYCVGTQIYVRSAVGEGS
ncbi:hypothetical protein [Halorubrum aethiopicum]|uniref:hypothetical protein n=1 Tax=Halorubrum aethiopicum TaxID=1758255 RepID=UPI00082F8802|nr:hypothetical protein [Halorubrum aethiopicum]